MTIIIQKIGVIDRDIISIIYGYQNKTDEYGITVSESYR